MALVFEDERLARIEAALRAARHRWGLSEGTAVSLLSISENATYLAQDAASGRKLVLRVQRPGYHSEDEIRSELAWIAQLREDGIVEAPAPVPTLDGTLLCGIEDNAERFVVVAFEHMSGKQPEVADDLPKWFERLGRMSARMHAHSRSYAPPVGFVRKRWDYETTIGPRAAWGSWRMGPGLDLDGEALLVRTAARLKDQLAAYGDGAERFGLIHADMRPANLLVEGERLGVIDFDDCGTGWFMFDFAASVGMQEHEPFIPEVQAAWLEGYRGVAPLAQEDEAALPMLMMVRRMQMTGWIASHAETPSAREAGAAFTQGTVALAERYMVGGGSLPA